MAFWICPSTPAVCRHVVVVRLQDGDARTPVPEPTILHCTAISSPGESLWGVRSGRGGILCYWACGSGWLCDVESELSGE
jgi:hypothetical protein